MQHLQTAVAAAYRPHDDNLERLPGGATDEARIANIEKLERKIDVVEKAIDNPTTLPEPLIDAKKRVKYLRRELQKEKDVYIKRGATAVAAAIASEKDKLTPKKRQEHMELQDRPEPDFKRQRQEHMALQDRAEPPTAVAASAAMSSHQFPGASTTAPVGEESSRALQCRYGGEGEDGTAVAATSCSSEDEDEDVYRGVMAGDDDSQTSADWS